MIDHLSANICTVTFTKVDGAERIMDCTLKSDLLPPPKELNEFPVRKVNESIVSAWDVKADGWRSFRVDSVTGFECPADVA